MQKLNKVSHNILRTKLHNKSTALEDVQNFRRSITDLETRQMHDNIARINTAWMPICNIAANY